MHMTLYPADVKVVLEAVWGEKHSLARGGWFDNFVPEGFIMVYAPGGKEDLEVLVRIVEAGTWFVGWKGAVGEGDEGVKEVSERGEE